MPELPEVECCRQNLDRWTRGKIIEVARAASGPPLRSISRKAFEAGLRGKQVLAVRRLGKQLFLDLSGDQILLLHLGMTGKVERGEPSAKVIPGERFRLLLSGQKRPVIFVDRRRFGRVHLLPKKKALALPEVKKLGPDAMQICADPSGLHSLFSKTKRPIKVLLLDQSRLAGVGNIYASESLFLSRILPSARAADLREKQVQALAKALLEVMSASIARMKGERVEYFNDGDIDNPFRVYGREGEPCPRCRTKIQREVQAGRSTFFCPRCQMG